MAPKHQKVNMLNRAQMRSHIWIRLRSVSDRRSHVHARFLVQVDLVEQGDLVDQGGVRLTSHSTTVDGDGVLLEPLLATLHSAALDPVDRDRDSVTQLREGEDGKDEQEDLSRRCLDSDVTVADGERRLDGEVDGVEISPVLQLAERQRLETDQDGKASDRQKELAAREAELFVVSGIEWSEHAQEPVEEQGDRDTSSDEDGKHCTPESLAEIGVVWPGLSNAKDEQVAECDDGL